MTNLFNTFLHFLGMFGIRLSLLFQEISITNYNNFLWSAEQKYCLVKFKNNLKNNKFGIKDALIEKYSHNFDKKTFLSFSISFFLYRISSIFFIWHLKTDIYWKYYQAIDKFYYKISLIFFLLLQDRDILEILSNNHLIFAVPPFFFSTLFHHFKHRYESE